MHKQMRNASKILTGKREGVPSERTWRKVGYNIGMILK
jgi:hypothetical protein